MSKSTRRRRKPAAKKPELHHKEDHEGFLTTRKIWSAILAMCTLLGAVVLWPRVSVDIEKEPDFSSALPNFIAITNTGWVVLHDLSVSFGLCRSKSDQNASFLGRDKTAKCNGTALQGSIAHVTAWAGHTLLSDEKWTLPPAGRFMNFGTGKLVEGDVDYILSFWSWPIPFYHHTIEFRFATQAQPNGSLIWAPIPID